MDDKQEVKFYIKNKWLFSLFILFMSLWVFIMLGLAITIQSNALGNILQPLNIWHGDLDGLSVGLLILLNLVIACVLGYVSIGERKENNAKTH